MDVWPYIAPAYCTECTNCFIPSNHKLFIDYILQYVCLLWYIVDSQTKQVDPMLYEHLLFVLQFIQTPDWRFGGCIQ